MRLYTFSKMKNYLYRLTYCSIYIDIDKITLDLSLSHFYCGLHADVKNVHLESIEHHIKFKDPEAHKSELLKCPEITHE